MNTHPSDQTDASFLCAYQGRFENLLRWPMLDELWSRLQRRANEGWYVYAVGEQPPSQPLDGDSICRFIVELDVLLRENHKETYCGIVYADNLQSPSMIKVFDPDNLGASCGASGSIVLPGWTISLLKPSSLPEAFPQPGNRKRWWQSLFA